MASTAGPFGGSGGGAITPSILPADAVMQQLQVSYGDVINSILLFGNVAGPEVKKAEIAGAWFSPTSKVLNLASRKITNIRGSYGYYDDQRTVVIMQIEFILDNGVSTGLLGLKKGDQFFQCDVPTNSVLRGFFGKVGNVIDSLGFQFG